MIAAGGAVYTHKRRGRQAGAITNPQKALRILSTFDTFTLCGLDGVTVTSLEAETGQAVTVADVLPILTDEVARTFNLAIPDPWVCPSCGSWQWEHEDGACPLTSDSR